MKIIHFDYLTLELFLKENGEFFLNSRVQKIQQPTRQEIILFLRNQGQSKKFYININPRFFHICFISEENEKRRFIEISKSLRINGDVVKQKRKNIYAPPMFCMLLRKYIESAKIAKIVQPANERILEFYFETYNEISEKIYLCLAIELMGKHSNVILYNYDTNVIIGCAHNVGSDKSRERELIGGLPYIYPPKALNKSFKGFSNILKSQSRSDILAYQQCNNTIDKYFSALQKAEKIKNLKSKLLTTTNAKLKKTKIALGKIQKQTASTEKADSYRKMGDLIMANLFHNQDFVKSIEVFDYEINSPLKIKLDETKTLKENANQYYKLYNKAKTAHLKTEEMVQKLNLETDYLEQVLYSVNEAKTIEELFEIDEEEREKVLKNGKLKIGDGKLFYSKPLNFRLFDHSTQKEFTVFIGKNNKQNDYIVSKLARSEDLWFHTHNCAGSHVLLRVEAGQEITDETVFKCAKLAKQYSSAKNSSKAGVIYTKAKNLKKPPGANLGYVIYKNEKEIMVD